MSKSNSNLKKLTSHNRSTLQYSESHDIHLFTNIFFSTAPPAIRAVVGPKLPQCEGGVTPWASLQVITGSHRHKPPTTLTFTPWDNLEFPAEANVHVCRLWEEVKASGEKPTSIHRNMQRKNHFGIQPATFLG